MTELKSLLFVPAEEKRLKKIGTIQADAYIIDLEDSIAPEDKDKALKRTAAFLRNYRANNLFVRVNHKHYLRETEVLRQFDVGFMLPKIESEKDYAAIEAILKNREVIALIETPKAVVNVNSIAAIPWVTALAFGAEDFSVAADMANNMNSLQVPKSLISIAAKANNKKVYDTPCFSIDDTRLLEAESLQAVELGFDGKLAIHPKQVETINQTFCMRNTDYMKYLVETYDSSGSAVCTIDGRVYEKLHIDRIRKELQHINNSCL